MSKIFWDTNIFIYLFEGHPQHLPAARHLRERMLVRGDELVTSAMTVAEIQVQARRMGDIVRAQHFRDLVRNSSKILDFNSEAADIFAHLRATTSLRPPDAIQLSCAASIGVELFITNDNSLHSLNISGIHFITSMDRAPI